MKVGGRGINHWKFKIPRELLAQKRSNRLSEVRPRGESLLPLRFSTLQWNPGEHVANLVQMHPGKWSADDDVSRKGSGYFSCPGLPIISLQSSSVFSLRETS